MPLKAWVKNALDYVISDCMNEPGLEFVWVGDDAIDPLEQAQTLQILVGAGIKTREEARADWGLGRRWREGSDPAGREDLRHRAAARRQWQVDGVGERRRSRGPSGAQTTPDQRPGREQ